jgi:hypothetical protein
VLNIQPAEPKVINVEDELDPPGFDLNTYCEKIVYRPLTSTNLAMDNLLPNNWCVRGDTDIVDKSKGFGDAYADVQGAAYQDMKNNESNLIANKNVIQFRLINDTNAPITTSVLNTISDPSVFTGKAKITYNDFFLPAIDDLTAMNNELFNHGIGGFSVINPSDYVSSSELAATTIWFLSFGQQVTTSIFKLTTNGLIRPCRSFISSQVYALRDTGPSGGWIYNIISNGDGTYTYSEAAAYDIIAVGQIWSNISNILIGTTGSAIGTGMANTLAIIAQAGHVTSAALLCRNLKVIN